MSIREAKLHLNDQSLSQENVDHIKNLLDEGKIVPNAVLTANHKELLDIIRRYPLPTILYREITGTISIYLYFISF